MPGFNINGGGGPSNTVETVRSNRWSLTVLEPLKPVLMYASKCQRPSVEYESMPMHQGQDLVTFPGKHRWLPIEMVFYEPVESYDLTAGYLDDWLYQAMMDVQSSSLQPTESYKKRCELQLEDGFGNPVYIYKLLDVWPSRVVPTGLDYSNSSFGEIAVTLEVGKVTVEKGSSSPNANQFAC